MRHRSKEPDICHGWPARNEGEFLAERVAMPRPLKKRVLSSVPQFGDVFKFDVGECVTFPFFKALQGFKRTSHYERLFTALGRERGPIFRELGGKKKAGSKGARHD